MPFHVIYRETDKQISNPDYTNHRHWVIMACDTREHAETVANGASVTFTANHPQASYMRIRGVGGGARYHETIVSYGRNYGSGDIIRQTDIYITLVDK